jgi:hypothetical protein
MADLHPPRKAIAVKATLTPRRSVVLIAFPTVVLGGLIANYWLTHAAGQDAADATGSFAGRPKERLREGTELVNVLGSFKLTGDRATFYPADGSGRFGGLENQTLERVAMVIGEDPSLLEWLVTGTITEYKGNNYILVTRAILKSKPSALGKPVGKPQK